MPKPSVIPAVLFRTAINNECGQDVAEYALLLAIILVVAIGVAQLVGLFSSVASRIGGAQ